MGVADIYIDGIISSDYYSGCSLPYVQFQLSMVDKPDAITVHINSVGGEVNEGWAIHDFLRTQGVPVTTINEGYCASMATIIHLAGDADKRLMLENAKYMIHNPWTYAAGNASELTEAIQHLLKEEARMAAFYTKATGLSFQDITEMMAVETEMVASECLKQNFISKIIETSVPTATISARKREYSKMCAQIRAGKAIKQNEITMSKSVIEGITSAVEALAKAIKGPIKAGSVSTDNGDLHFGGGEVGEGDAVYSDPEMTTAAPDGDYSKDSLSYSVKDGKVDSISPAEDEDDAETEASADKPAKDPEADDEGDGDEEAKAEARADDSEVTALKAKLSKEVIARKKAVAEIKAVKDNVTVWSKSLTDAAELITSLKAELAKDRESIKAEIKSSFEFTGESRVTKGTKEVVKINPFENSMSEAGKKALARSK